MTDGKTAAGRCCALALIVKVLFIVIVPAENGSKADDTWGNFG